MTVEVAGGEMPGEVDVQARQDVIDRLRKVTAGFSVAGKGFSRSHGLQRTDAEALLLVVDAERDGEPLGPSRLARGLGISTASATVLVDRLVAAGHVRRHLDPADRRRVTLAVSAATMASAADYFAELNTRLLACLGDVPPEDIATVAGVLDTLLAALDTPVCRDGVTT
ncbi:MarR family winged helix-turn-helix transcriptional regulator [Actinokineospora guangxiensis]|uniref:MarR family winged helix-turn-helix transcriptional regulator n=1 Tax=Actinokineospora guangxiensis TaxID=1490288 RepID=A0ABW0ERR5_9PSEU